MLTYAALDRREFLDWLGDEAVPEGRKTSAPGDLIKASRAGQLTLVWPGPSTGPSTLSNPVILVRDQEYRDFLAWAVTYVKSFVPFTAFFRVLRLSTVHQFELFGPRQIYFEKEILEPLAAVVIAEAATQIGSASALSQISLQACQATFSFAALKCLSAGMHPAHLTDIGDAWSQARSVATESSPRLNAQTASSFWLLCGSALLDDFLVSSNSDEGWAHALMDLIRTSRRGDDLESSLGWSYLSKEIPQLGQFSRVSQLPRESQIISLDETARYVKQAHLPPFVADAAVGFQAARLSNGSFDYIGILNDHREALPTALLWFALFSIWRPGFDGLIAGQCLGRRVAKHAITEVDVFDAPDADISLGEFEILLEAKQGRFRTDLASSIDIEIAPLVTAKFPRAVRQDSVERSPMGADHERLRRTLSDALKQVDSLLGPKANQTYSDGLFAKQSSEKRSRPRKK